MPQSMIGFLVGLAVLLVVALVPGRRYHQGPFKRFLEKERDAEESACSERRDFHE